MQQLSVVFAFSSQTTTGMSSARASNSFTNNNNAIKKSSSSSSSSSTSSKSSSPLLLSSSFSRRRRRRREQDDGLKTSAFFDDLKQKASQVLEKSRDDDDEEEDKDKETYPEESTDYDDENANPFKTMLQKGMKKPAFISRDEGDEEYVNYDNTVDEMEEEMETNNKGFSSAAENLIPKFSGLPKFKIPEMKASAATQTPAYAEEEKEEESTETSNPFAKMLKKSKSVQMTKAAQGERDFDTAIKERVSSKAAAALMEATDTSTAKWTLTPDSSTTKKRLGKINLKNGDVFIIGREKGNGVDVSVPLPCVSGVHCQLEMERNKLYVTDLGSTNGTYVDGFQLRKNNRFRIFNQSVVRLGAENRDGEDYASFGTDLTGADEMEKNSEYGQLNYFIEFLGGPKVVINFIFINLAFQGTFFILLKYL